MINAYAPAYIDSADQAIVHYVPGDAEDWCIGPQHDGTGVLRVTRAGDVTIFMSYGKPIVLNAHEIGEIVTVAQDLFDGLA